MNREDISGGARTGESLRAAFDSGRFPHAVLLEGGPGSGTREAALLLAKAAVCLAETGRPCGKCPGCVKAQAGSHPDITLLDGDENPKAYPVDVIREIRSGAYIRPNEAPRKVYVLLGADKMSEVSQNALLKVLEEPPANILFLLTAGSASALLPTIRSRVEIFSFAGRTAPEGCGEASQIARAVLSKNGTDLLFAAAPLIQDRIKLRGALEHLTLIFRDAAVFRSGCSASLSGEEAAASALGGALTRERLLQLYQETQKTRRALEQNANAALLVTAYCASLRGAAGR